MIEPIINEPINNINNAMNACQLGRRFGLVVKMFPPKIISNNFLFLNVNCQSIKFNWIIIN